MSILVYDFDKTLTNEDSLSHIIYNKIGCKYHILLLYIGLKILSKIKLITVRKEKEIICSILFKGEKDLSHSIIKYISNIKLNTIADTIDVKFNNNKIIILSAAPEELLMSIFPHYTIIGAKLIYKSNRFIIKQHPYGDEKLSLLIKNGITLIDECYYDSISDECLLKISRRGFKIKNAKIIKVYENPNI